MLKIQVGITLGILYGRYKQNRIFLILTYIGICEHTVLDEVSNTKNLILPVQWPFDKLMNFLLDRNVLTIL